jgi:hypothetical protein
VPIFSVGPGGVARPDTVVETLLADCSQASASRTRPARSSRTGRRDAEAGSSDINSHVIRIRRAGVGGPDSAVVDLAHAMEHSDLHPDPSNVEPLIERASVSIPR